MESKFEDLVKKKAHQGIDKLTGNRLLKVASLIDELIKEDEYINEYINLGMKMGE
ncbi:hypothetical protein [Metabacillus arenae]|uniref:Uncharacterized protein n=1 Tax=Metabacillus arenae TaxID=2771434 RepID=A0A926RW25_9BACI|nr:hypothetical protein [Metabacillus arenae]MBD1379115.1 hypothetical protein [Metabacillus arenae]